MWWDDVTHDNLREKNDSSEWNGEQDEIGFTAAFILLHERGR